MRKFLTKTGNSYAIVIDRAVMELLNITPETPLKMTTNGIGFYVEPAREGVSDEQIDASMDRFYQRFGGMMKRLAE